MIGPIMDRLKTMTRQSAHGPKELTSNNSGLHNPFLKVNSQSKDSKNPPPEHIIKKAKKKKEDTTKPTVKENSQV